MKKFFPFLMLVVLICAFMFWTTDVQAKKCPIKNKHCITPTATYTVMPTKTIQPTITPTPTVTATRGLVPDCGYRQSDRPGLIMIPCGQVNTVTAIPALRISRSGLSGYKPYLNP